MHSGIHDIPFSSIFWTRWYFNFKSTPFRCHRKFPDIAFVLPYKFFRSLFEHDRILNIFLESFTLKWILSMHLKHTTFGYSSEHSEKYFSRFLKRIYISMHLNYHDFRIFFSSHLLNDEFSISFRCIWNLQLSDIPVFLFSEHDDISNESTPFRCNWNIWLPDIPFFSFSEHIFSRLSRVLVSNEPFRCIWNMTSGYFLLLNET